MATWIELGIKDWDAASTITIGSVDTLPMKKVPLGPGECDTCLDTDLVWTRKCCQVKICQACLQTYVDGKINDGVIDIQCPGHNCGTKLSQDYIKGAVDTVQAKRFSFLRVKSDKCKYKKACPMCDKVVVLDDAFLRFYDDLESIIVCPKCLKEWCFQCMVPWHEGKTCAEYKSFKTDTGIDKWAKKLENTGGDRNAQQCPKCQVWIQKIVGCYFMTCQECKTNFCYDCGAGTPHPIGSKCSNARTGAHGENQAPARPAAPRRAAPRRAAPRRAAHMPANLRARGHGNLFFDKIVARFTTKKCDIMWLRCAIVFVFVFICLIGILAHGMYEAYVRQYN